MKDIDEFLAATSDEAGQARQAVRDFVQAAAAADIAGMVNTFDLLDHGGMAGGGWVKAFHAISRISSVPNETRDAFLLVWLDHGDHIRLETGNDLALATGLRMLLPPYDGPPMRLYRGDGARNRSRRTYGMSWTADREVAELFAQRMWRSSAGGSVVLQTDAPAEAIICAPATIQSRRDYAEVEYLVDRRKLGRVTVLARYPQVDS